MPYLAGEPIIDIVTLRTPTGVLLTGATFTVLYSKHQNGAPALTTVEETASLGTYLVSTETSTTGGYHRILSATKDGAAYQFAGTAHVVSRGSPFEHYVGQPIEEVVYLTDDSAAAIAGAAFATELSSDPNGAPFTLIASAIAGVPGGYLLTVAPDAVGVWSAEVTTNTTPARRFRFEATVFDANPAIIGAPLSGGGRVIWQPIRTHRGRVTWQRIPQE